MGLDVTIDLFDLAAYEREVLPILDRFLATSDPIALASDIKLLFPQGLSDDLEDGVTILEGRQRYSPSTNHESDITLAGEMESFVQYQVAPFLVRENCVRSSQNVSRSALPLFLYEHSTWIQDFLCFHQSPSGGLLKYSSAEATEVFSEAEAQRFLLELVKVGSAPPDLQQGLDNLSRVVGAAEYAVGLVLSRSVG